MSPDIDTLTPPAPSDLLPERLTVMWQNSRQSWQGYSWEVPIQVASSRPGSQAGNVVAIVYLGGRGGTSSSKEASEATAKAIVDAYNSAREHDEAVAAKPDDPLTLLRRLLTEINSDARVEEANHSGTIVRNGKSVHPTHEVIDADGEELGWGISEADAIADAIGREFKRTEGRLDRIEQAVRNYKTARAALDNL